mgnify:CR=1 FL=1
MESKKETILHDGTKRTSFFDKEGFYHKEDGPAVVYSHGLEEWFTHGIRHRDDGPALFSSTFQEWYQKGIHHRMNGPAVITYNSFGEIKSQSFYLYGTQKTPKAWGQHTGHKVCYKCNDFCRQRCGK